MFYTTVFTLMVTKSSNSLIKEHKGSTPTPKLTSEYDSETVPSSHLKHLLILPYPP
jgi:hypothetical protein